MEEALILPLMAVPVTLPVMLLVVDSSPKVEGGVSETPFCAHANRGVKICRNKSRERGRAGNKLGRKNAIL
jgi:hypothetical protein